MVWLGPLTFLALCSSLAVAEPAAHVREPVTGTSFPALRSIGDRDHLLVGVGARKALGVITIFGAGLYVEREGGRAVWERYQQERFAPFRAGGALDFGRLRRSSALRHYLIFGNYSRALDLSFVRNTTKAQCNREFRDGLGRYLGDLDAPEVRTDVQRFLNDVSIKMAPGDHSVFRTQGDTFWVTGPDGRTRQLRNRRLVHAFWNMYFGREPIELALRDGLVSRIEAITH